jgi:hypothetical protein
MNKLESSHEFQNEILDFNVIPISAVNFTKCGVPLTTGESCVFDSVALLMRTEKRKIAVRVVVMIKILEKGWKGW